VPEINAAAAGSAALGDRIVNRIGFGAKRLAGRDRAVAVLRQAIRLGVNHIDTAAFYDSANEWIRQALAPYSDDLVIATKVGPTDNGLARPDELRGLVEENLRQLGLECLDVVNLRQFGLDDVSEHFGVLAELRTEGLIRHLGLSNVRPHHLAQAQAIAPVVCVQNRYGVDFGRVNDKLLETCRQQGIAFVPFFSLTGARREEGGIPVSDTVEAVAQAHAVSPAQVRIAWLLSRGAHIIPIPGTSDPAHLAENVAAAALELTADDLASLA
jgi:aryl-alcohol dehydrogenase-like predicted oxidoreductase